jgi:hypothetical protein
MVQTYQYFSGMPFVWCGWVGCEVRLEMGAVGAERQLCPTSVGAKVRPFHI